MKLIKSIDIEFIELNLSNFIAQDTHGYTTVYVQIYIQMHQLRGIIFRGKLLIQWRYSQDIIRFYFTETELRKLQNFPRVSDGKHSIFFLVKHTQENVKKKSTTYWSGLGHFRMVFFCFKTSLIWMWIRLHFHMESIQLYPRSKLDEKVHIHRQIWLYLKIILSHVTHTFVWE